jgi:hypothetical protein
MPPDKVGGAKLIIPGKRPRWRTLQDAPESTLQLGTIVELAIVLPPGAIAGVIRKVLPRNVMVVT